MWKSNLPFLLIINFLAPFVNSQTCIRTPPPGWSVIDPGSKFIYQSGTFAPIPTNSILALHNLCKGLPAGTTASKYSLPASMSMFDWRALQKFARTQRTTFGCTGAGTPPQDDCSNIAVGFRYHTTYNRSDGFYYVGQDTTSHTSVMAWDGVLNKEPSRTEAYIRSVSLILHKSGTEFYLLARNTELHDIYIGPDPKPTYYPVCMWDSSDICYKSSVEEQAAERDRKFNPYQRVYFTSQAIWYVSNRSLFYFEAVDRCAELGSNFELWTWDMTNPFWGPAPFEKPLLETKLSAYISTLDLDPVAIMFFQGRGTQQEDAALRKKRRKFKTATAPATGFEFDTVAYDVLKESDSFAICVEKLEKLCSGQIP